MITFTLGRQFSRVLPLLLGICLSHAAAAQVNCKITGIDLGLPEINPQQGGTYLSTGSLTLECKNKAEEPIMAGLVVYDSLAQPHILIAPQSSDVLELRFHSSDSRARVVGTNPSVEPTTAVAISAKSTRVLRVPIYPELRIPRGASTGDFEHPMTLRVAVRTLGPKVDVRLRSSAGGH